ncbi:MULTISPECIES: hypothetical protein [unclassified Bradyrhizobium]|uniref:hypothetical protein n=1 Tax=unclassified Bradyrhizobium TaxID=2631580 RepID=UPI002FF35A8E
MTEEKQLDMQKIMNDLDRRLGDEGCDEMRFALVVWCGCNPMPLYAGSNEEDMRNAASMVQMAAKLMSSVDPTFFASDVAGNA